MPNTSNFYQDSIFWVDVNKIKPNPFQPRHEFDEDSMRALADSIKQYGVLQALVVTRKEIIKDDGLGVEYELIAGERRLRASKMAGLSQVPVIIRMGEGEENKDDLMKLELAIIENVQREDLNPVERARAFKKLAEQFGFNHHHIAQKIGKSRVYVTNTMRILDLPEEMLIALSEGKINEGHTRPLIMLIERPGRFKADIDPTISAFEEKFTESLGTRVHIEKRDNGGKLMIEFFSFDDLEDILKMLREKEELTPILEIPESEPQPSVGVDDRTP